MIRNALNSIATAARNLLRNWRALVVFLVLYLALLAAIYFFVETHEATILQLLLNLILAIIAPALFFVLQAMGVSYMQAEAKLGALLRQAWREWWKLIVISVPIMLLAWLVIYLFGKLEGDVLGAVRDAARSTTTAPRPSNRAAEPPGRWLEISLTALRCLLLYIALPLAAIHLWIATARDGLGQAFKGIARVVIRAFAPRAVLIYAVGLVIFGVIPYFLISKRTPFGGAWVDMGLLSARLALAFVFIVFGWVMTLGALTNISAESATQRVENG